MEVTMRTHWMIGFPDTAGDGSAPVICQYTTEDPLERKP